MLKFSRTLSRNSKQLFAMPRVLTHQNTLRFYSNENVAEGSFLDRVAVTEAVVGIVQAHERVEPGAATEESHLIRDLGLDSLDAAEILVEVEETFNIEIPDDEAFELTSTPDIIDYIAVNPSARLPTE
mmetsp:Transcript_13883/g.21006  ORF Transcript_13883/g.21006 Transcript_13883/m.21006 type:complete len:128 (-) Transcript_13883:37-420(-)